MPNKYVIGDIHGCLKTFKKLMDNITPDIEDDIYLLGDYIDRGPDSKGVIDYILQLQCKGYKINTLIGNHEYMLIESISDSNAFDQWSKNGCLATLRSFNIKHPKELDEKYQNFFNSLEYFFIVDDFVLVHAGMNFDIDDPFSDLYSMVWLRSEFVDKPKISGRRLIVGHTPKPIDFVRNTLKTDKIMLDSGCVYHGRYPNIGFLTAYCINKNELTFVENIDG